MNYIKTSYVTALLLATSVLMSCKKDEEVAPNKGIDTTAVVNSWLERTMREVYFWTDQIPKPLDKTLAPKDFFKSMLSPDDRFSVIYPDYQELIRRLSGVSKEAGYEFVLSRVSGSETDVVAVIIYVKKGSPAALAGMKRGDVVSSVNGVAMTLSNYSSLIGQTSEAHTLDFRRIVNGSYANQPKISLTTLEIAENPNFLDSVYTLPGGAKVGYFVYNFFSAGVSGSEYDQQVDLVFAKFKAAGVQDLVLDLRYNSGGSLSSATNLASLMGKNISSSKIFYENKWNQAYQTYISGRADGDQILRGRFKDKAQNIGGLLSAGRVFVLTGTRTASASELIINGLRPFMNVVLIGDKTVGKNVGSIALQDEGVKSNKYGILPIVLKIFNSLGQSDYDKGFTPNFSINEFSTPLLPLGDVKEILLNKALNEVLGGGITLARAPDGEEAVNSPEILGSSIDKKARTNRLIVDQK